MYLRYTGTVQCTILLYYYYCYYYFLALGLFHFCVYCISIGSVISGTLATGI